MRHSLQAVRQHLAPHGIQVRRGAPFADGSDRYVASTYRDGKIQSVDADSPQWLYIRALRGLVRGN